MQILYYAFSKESPQIIDKSVYNTISCKECGHEIREIIKLGVYLPKAKKTFGIIATLGGLIASEKSVDYLYSEGIKDFEVQNAEVTFGNGIQDGDKFYWIKPIEQIELDVKRGPGPEITCNVCERREWKDNGITLPKVMTIISSEVSQIKYTWLYIVSDNFIKISKKTPNGCYLNFEPWYYDELV